MANQLSKKKVLITRKFPGRILDILQDSFDIILHDSEFPLSRKQLLEYSHDVDGIICSHSDDIDYDFITSCTNLKVISTFSVGYDHIDIKTATKKGIYVTNTPDVLTDATADLTIALLLTLTRRLDQSQTIMKNKKWINAGAPNFLLGTELNNKIFGIIGFGRIGMAVSKRAQSFGMDIIYNNRTRFDVAKELKFNITYKNLDELLKTSDVISIHVDLNKSTLKFINYEKLCLMKPNSYLINTSRGQVIDEKSLIKILLEDKISGAALDVFENEPLSVDDEIFNLKNIILTPHIGSATFEARSKMGEICALDVFSVLSSKTPSHLVNQNVEKIRPLV